MNKVEIKELFPLAFVSLVSNLLESDSDSIKVEMEVTESDNIDVTIITNRTLSVIKSNQTIITVASRNTAPAKVILDNNDYLSLKIR